MGILNLANPAESVFDFEVHSFPDGQQNIVIKENFVYDEVTIKSRMNSFRDLELIICSNHALKKKGAKEITLYVPYFLGARSDRPFGEGECHYLRDVICPIINAQGFYKVQVLDPHSPVLEACLNNFEEIGSWFWKWAVPYLPGDSILVLPDAGAQKRYSILKDDKFTSILRMDKRRNSDGSISVSWDDYATVLLGQNYVIVDDICDGGGTFIEIAREIKAHNSKAKIYLVVTHGIFSKGLGELGKYFEKIYTTNSILDVETPSSYIHSFDRATGRLESRKLLNQFEVFE